jgi:hypothetical protein
MGFESICRALGRCAYDVANGEPDSGCPHWSDCFAPVPTEEPRPQ